MRHVKTVPLYLVDKSKALQLDQFGFTLIWKNDSLEIWK